MDMENLQHCQQTSSSNIFLPSRTTQAIQVSQSVLPRGYLYENRLDKSHACSDMKRSADADRVDSTKVLEQIRQNELLVINSRRRNGLILFKKYHAEFAGPGAAVGASLDRDCERVCPVGSLSLLLPQSYEERQKAFLIRRQWIRLTYQFTQQETPLKRAQMIMNQFENYFDRETIADIPDEAFALLVGVLPHTVRLARRPPRRHNVKFKRG